MAVKPTTLPRWADSGAVIIEPNPGKKDIGWVSGSKPPAEFENWRANLTYEWFVHVNDLLSQGGGALGTIDIQAEDEASIVPVQHFRDFNGEVRSLVDHNGYRMGQLSEWDEHWRILRAVSSATTGPTNGTTDPEGWFFESVPAGNGTRRYGAPIAPFPMRHVEMVAVSGVIHSAVLQPVASGTGEGICFTSDDILYVQEWFLRTGTVLDAVDGTITIGGISGAGGGQGMFFRYADGDVNWQARTGGADVADLGVAMADNTTYRMRMEIVGESQHAGSDYLLRWYIDGVLVHEENDAFADDTFKPYYSIGSPNLVDGPYNMLIGRIRCVWNHLLSPDEL